MILLFDFYKCYGHNCVGKQTKFPTCEKQKKKKKHAKEKQSHAQDNIYVVQQFAYVLGVAEISLLSGKNTEYNLRLQYFLSNKNTATAYQPKPPLHGLSLSKSPIKKSRKISRVRLGRQTRSNKIRLHKAQQIV